MVDSQQGEETHSSEFSTYSKFGFTFEYPTGMSLHEEGTLESTATNDSGRVTGELRNDEYEAVGVGWLTALTTTDIEDLKEAVNAGLASMEAVNPIDRGQLVTSEKAGDVMIYQYFNSTVGGESRYGVFGCWNCESSDRLYQLIVMSSEENVLQIYERYLDSFTCH
jgi:hypothetical protein